MTDLDLEAIYKQLDPSGLGRRIADFPHHCREAWEDALALSLPPQYATVERVVVMGMGGSAIGGDLLSDLASLEDAPQVTVVRDYTLPQWVDEKTLALACSYSGNTEETLSAFHQALERGAKCVAVTSGGTLAKEAREARLPVYAIDFSGEPRSALAYLFLAPVAILQKLGLIVDKSAALQEALEELDGLQHEIRPSTPSASNKAKQIALALNGRAVVVYGAGYFSAVARRWKTQLNENSKAWAFWETLPELNHNAVVGYPFPKDMQSKGYVVMLAPRGLHPQVVKRYMITDTLLEQAKVPHRMEAGRGESPLSEMLTCIHLGDHVSYYLAALYGVDPAPVKTIDYVKGNL